MVSEASLSHLLLCAGSVTDWKNTSAERYVRENAPDSQVFGYVNNTNAIAERAGISVDIAFTSMLKRAIRTLWIMLDEMDRMWIPVERSWRLNERHYGALQGLNKAETVARHGEAQVKIWRRSYDIPPPALTADDPRHPRFDVRYAGIDPALLPAAESLKETLARVQPFWQTRIAPELAAGRNVLVAAHGNSLRAMVK
ncbi:MAG: phosphoglyceromutase, partial [Actinomycetota bacterium]